MENSRCGLLSLLLYFQWFSLSWSLLALGLPIDSKIAFSSEHHIQTQQHKEEEMGHIA